MRLNSFYRRGTETQRFFKWGFSVPLCLCGLILLGAVHAAQVEESKVEAQTRELALNLRCTVCQSESVWESNSTLAQQVRALIRERLEKGETPQQVKEYLFSRYGDYILMEPRRAGLNWLLWGAPLALLLAGTALLWRMLRRWHAGESMAAVSKPAPVDEAHRSRIEQELRKLGDD